MKSLILKIRHKNEFQSVLTIRQRFSSSIFFLILMYLGAYPGIIHCMNILALFRRQPTKQETIHNFLEEFPNLKLNEIKNRYDTCSPDEQKIIDQKFVDKNNQSLYEIFTIATQLPRDVQRPIVLHIFNNNQIATQKFLSLPIRKAYELYAWSQDVFEERGTISRNFYLNSIDCVFQLSQEIKTAITIINHNKNNNNKQLYLGKKDIKILQTIREHSMKKDNIFKEQDFLCQHYRPFTKDDFITLLVPTAILSAAIYTPLTLIWLSRAIEFYLCKKIIIDPSLPQKIEQLKQLIQHSGNMKLLDAVCNPEANMAYNWISHLKKNIPFLLCMSGIGILASLPHDRENFWKDAVLFDGIYGIPSSIVCYLLSWIPFERFPGGFLGLYAAIPIIMYGIVLILFRENHWVKEHINCNSLEEILDRKGIFIPEESRILKK